MFNGSSRRVVVIKDIHSNLIEEAILILKNDPEPSKGKDKNECQKNKKKNNDFLIKEAEFIINNYVKENKLNLVNGRQPQKKLTPPKNKKLINIAINAVMIGSVALLVFLVSRMF